MENKRIIQVDEKVPVKLLIPLSIQHMFAMFGASVLVPFLPQFGQLRFQIVRLWSPGKFFLTREGDCDAIIILTSSRRPSARPCSASTCLK